MEPDQKGWGVGWREELGTRFLRSREHKGGHNLELDPEAEFPVRWSRRARWTGRLESNRVVGTRVGGAVAVQQQHQLLQRTRQRKYLAASSSTNECPHCYGTLWWPTSRPALPPNTTTPPATAPSASPSTPPPAEPNTPGGHDGM